MYILIPLKDDHSLRLAVQEIHSWCESYNIKGGTCLTIRRGYDTVQRDVDVPPSVFDRLCGVMDLETAILDAEQWRDRQRQLDDDLYGK